MKNISFSALLYREWLLVKKPFLLNSAISLATILLTVLLSLSFRYGNLKTRVGEEFMNVMGVKYWVILAVGFMIAMMSSETVGQDIKKPMWDHFLRSTPISSCRFALVKTITNLITKVFAVVFTIPAMCLICYVMGTSVTIIDISIILLAIFLVTVLDALLAIVAYYFKSTDKAGIAVIVLIMVFMFGVISPGFDKMASLISDNPFQIERIVASLSAPIMKVTSYVPAMYIAVFVLYFVAFLLIFKRREK